MKIGRIITSIWTIPIAGIILVFILSGIVLVRCTSDNLPITAFSTGGHSVYHLQPAKVRKSGQKAIVAATFDGTILCYTQGGKTVWEKKVNDFFPFDLAVADIDNDGLDEVFVATAGGTVDALDADGTHLWSFKREAPLFQVCPVRTGSGEWVILTGGVEEEIFSLSARGDLLNSIKVGDVVRHIRKGDILGDGKEYAAVATASSGLFGKLSLMLIDPYNLKLLWQKTNLGSTANDSGRRFYSMTVVDMNSDGRQDIVLSGSWGGNGEIFGFDCNGRQMFVSSDQMVPIIHYRMNLLTRVNLKDSIGENIFGLFANYIIVYDKNGVIQRLLKSRYDFSSAAFDYNTSTYFLGSSPSGGDGIYALHLEQPGWDKAFEEIRPVGKLAQIEKNIEQLKEQIAVFKRPDYQKALCKITITSPKPEGVTFNYLNFNSRLRVTENYGDRSELWCRDIDQRLKYNLKSEEIVKLAREKEARGEDFTVVAGHGSAFYMSPATLKKIIIAAPIHFQGFVFGEMSKVDSNMQEVVTKLVLPLAEECSKVGKKIILDNKFVFWNGTCYLDFWKRVLLNPRFSNVFVPALEESNCRTQELSLAGRVGLWMTGCFNNWSTRAIMDNACFDWMREWGSQQIISHHIRHLVIQTSMGSDILSIGLIQGPLTKDILPQLLPFYNMIEKGIIAIPEKDDLLSVSDLCIGMKSPPSADFITHGVNGGIYNFDEVKRSPMVFDRLDCYWGAAPLEDYDFSSYGYGCERRMLNFLPKNPYGLVSIVPDDIDLSEFPRFRDKVTTDGQYFYDSSGEKHGPAEYKAVMLEKLKESAAHLPVLVKGDVAWSVVRLDPGHVRVTIVDPGYTDPDDREAEVVLQHINGTECTDILSGEKLEIKEQKIHLRVPAGIFRIIDIKH